MNTDIRHTESEPTGSEPPWRSRGFGLRIVFGVVVTVIIVGGGLFLAYPRVGKWRKDRTLRLVEQYLHTEDYRSAYLLAEQLVHDDPSNVVARRLLARSYEAVAPEQALIEWDNLTKAEPGNPSNYIGYASAALRSGNPDRLSVILPALQKLEPESVEYHRLAAASAMATGNFAQLRSHVDRLVALEPRNPLTRFTLATLQLSSTNPMEIEQGRASMGTFVLGDELRIRATLALISDAPRRWPDEEIPARRYTRLVDELKLRGPGAVPRYVRIQGDRLPAPGLPILIGHMQAQPTLTANDAAMLAQWMLQIGQGREALIWLDTRDEPLRSTLLVRQGMATCAAALEAWPRLEQLVSEGAWGPVPVEAVKQAFRAHDLWTAHNDSKAGAQWNNAIRLCEQSLPGLRLLQRLARIWRWPDREAQVLWGIVHQFPADEPAWRALMQSAQVAGNSAELARISQLWVQAVPANPAVRAEWILLGLIIRPNETGLRARAAELFQKHPEIPACRVAEALALWRASRGREAETLLEEGERLNFELNPHFMLVHGLVQAAVGRKADAEKTLGLLRKVKLLPEERVLLEQAQKAGG
jgi:hypothetical protein